MAKHDCCASCCRCCCCCCSHNLVDQLLLLLWFAASTFCRATLRIAFQFTFSWHFLFGAFQIDLNFDFCFFILLNITHFSNTVRRGPSAVVTKAPINSDRSTLVRFGSLGYCSRLAIPFSFSFCFFFCFFLPVIFLLPSFFCYFCCCWFTIVFYGAQSVLAVLIWLVCSSFFSGFRFAFLMYIFIFNPHEPCFWVAFLLQEIGDGTTENWLWFVALFVERVFLSGYVFFFFCLGIKLCVGLGIVHVIKSHC